MVTRPASWSSYNASVSGAVVLKFNIFVNPSAIETKIAGKLVDDTEQVSGETKLLGVKREQNPP